LVVTSELSDTVKPVVRTERRPSNIVIPGAIARLGLPDLRRTRNHSAYDRTTKSL
jgi:hypothetical protein